MQKRKGGTAIISLRRECVKLNYKPDSKDGEEAARGDDEGRMKEH